MKGEKRLFRSFLRYDWWKILGVFGILAAVLGFAFNYKDKLKENEILDIFVTGEAKDLSFQEPLYSMVDNSEVKAVHCSAYSLQNVEFNQIASSYISGVSDLYLLPENVLSSNPIYLSYAKNIEEDNAERIGAISSFSFYQGELSKPRGIKIYDKEDASYNQGKKFSSWFDFDETTYLFVSDSSTNRLSMTSHGKSLLWEFAYSFLELGVS